MIGLFQADIVGLSLFDTTDLFQVDMYYLFPADQEVDMRMFLL
jgi:hypothetical protein